MTFFSEVSGQLLQFIQLRIDTFDALDQFSQLLFIQPDLFIFPLKIRIAAASAATQVTGASVSGMLAHLKRDGVDLRLGGVLVAGGVVGSLIGAGLFEWLRSKGQIDTVISILYLVLLGGIGSLMLRESLGSAVGAAQRWGGAPTQAPAPPHRPDAAVPLALLSVGPVHVAARAVRAWASSPACMTMLLGVGGGFIMVPAMLYILGMGAQVVVGTSLFQILFTTIATTMIHSVTTRAVDIVLALLLLVGGVIGAQYGARLAQRIDPARLRLGLSIIVLAVALRMALGLVWQPDDIALQEAWMHDVPSLVWNPGVMRYLGHEWRDPAIAAPYLTEESGRFFAEGQDIGSVIERFIGDLATFAPRRYCMSHLSDRVCAEAYLDLVGR